MKNRFPGITSLNDQRVKAMHKQYQQRASTSSPRRSPSSPRNTRPEERVLAMVQSDKIRRFLKEHRAVVIRHLENLEIGFASLDAINLRLEDLKMRKILHNELDLIQRSPRGAFSEFVRSVAGLGVNILYAFTKSSKKATNLAADPQRIREYNEWKVLWYNIVDPRSKMWNLGSVSNSQLTSMSKKDLYFLASQLGIRGRSKMNDRDLVSAIKKKIAE